MSVKNIKASCPHCNVSLNVRPELIGTEAKCPKCRKSFVVRKSPEPEEEGFYDQIIGGADEYREDVPEREPPNAATESFDAAPTVRKYAMTPAKPLKDVRYSATNFIAGAFRVCGILQCLGILVMLYATVIGGQFPGTAGVAYAVSVIAAMSVGAAILFAAAELLSAMIRIETNTRTSANLLLELRNGSQP